MDTGCFAGNEASFELKKEALAAPAFRHRAHDAASLLARAHALNYSRSGRYYALEISKPRHLAAR